MTVVQMKRPANTRTFLATTAIAAITAVNKFTQVKGKLKKRRD